MEEKIKKLVTLLEDFGFSARSILTPHSLPDDAYSAALYEYGRDAGREPPPGFVWASRDGNVMWLGIETDDKKHGDVNRAREVERVIFALGVADLAVMQMRGDMEGSCLLAAANRKEDFVAVKKFLRGYVLVKGNDWETKERKE